MSSHGLCVLTATECKNALKCLLLITGPQNHTVTVFVLLNVHTMDTGLMRYAGYSGVAFLTYPDIEWLNLARYH